MKKQTRNMWILIDKDEPLDRQLRDAIDGGLYATKPIPSFDFYKPVRVLVTIAAPKGATE